MGGEKESQKQSSTAAGDGADKEGAGGKLDKLKEYIKLDKLKPYINLGDKFEHKLPDSIKPYKKYINYVGYAVAGLLGFTTLYYGKSLILGKGRGGRSSRSTAPSGGGSSKGKGGGGYKGNTISYQGGMVSANIGTHTGAIYNPFTWYYWVKSWTWDLVRDTIYGWFPRVFKTDMWWYYGPSTLLSAGVLGFLGNPLRTNDDKSKRWYYGGPMIFITFLAMRYGNPYMLVLNAIPLFLAYYKRPGIPSQSSPKNPCPRLVEEYWPWGDTSTPARPVSQKWAVDPQRRARGRSSGGGYHPQFRLPELGLGGAIGRFKRKLTAKRGFLGTIASMVWFVLCTVPYYALTVPFGCIRYVLGSLFGCGRRRLSSVHDVPPPATVSRSKSLENRLLLKGDRDHHRGA